MLFAGGDGTARDVAEGLDTALRAYSTDGLAGRVAPPEATRIAGRVAPPEATRIETARRGLDTALRAYSTDVVAALGIPAGVKMYSPVFAVSPRAAGGIAAAWLADGSLPVLEREVLDVDEDAAPARPRRAAAVRHARRALPIGSHPGAQGRDSRG